MDRFVGHLIVRLDEYVSELVSNRHHIGRPAECCE